MIWFEAINMAWQQIRANKTRSFLTILGIVIGIATVVLIVSVLEGYRKNIEGEFGRLGANTFIIKKYDDGHIQVGEQDRNRKDLQIEYANMIKRHCESVSHAAIYSYFAGQVHYKQNSTLPNIIIIGTNEDYPYAAGFNLDRGRFYSTFEVKNDEKVIILGMDIVEKLFPYEDPIGKKVRLKNQKFTVVGIMEEMGDLNMGQSRDNRVFIPISTFRMLYGKGWAVEMIIQARSTELSTIAQDEVIRYLRKVRRVPPNKPNDFVITTSEGLMESFGNIANKITMIASGIGLMSLLVGSIGVMAIMLVSVTERTREIGVRKAIGARSEIVLFQFLMESITLTAFGGVIGVGLGILLAFLASSAFNLAFTLSLWAMIVSFIVTVLIGVGSGLYPAFKASRVHPIEALRYE